MAKPKRKKRKPSGAPATPAVDRDALLAELAATREGLSAERMGPEWGVMQRSLAKAGADSTFVARAIATRDLDLLDRIIANLHDPTVDIAPPEPEPEPGVDIPEEVLREAMRAYRKRVRVTKLDQESQLARSPLSSGKDADIDAIVPPNQFPPEVWRTLAHRGELEATGDGFYRIPIQRRDF